MKKLLLLFIASVWIVCASNAQVGINADQSEPDPSAGLDVNSTTKGCFCPE